MTHDSHQNPYDAPANANSSKPPLPATNELAPNALTTLIATVTLTLVGVQVMAVVRNPMSTIPTLHSDSSFIIGFREATTGPGGLAAYPIALVVVCLPPMILHSCISIAALIGLNTTSKIWSQLRHGAHWLGITYATGWLICLLV